MSGIEAVYQEEARLLYVGRPIVKRCDDDVTIVRVPCAVKTLWEVTDGGRTRSVWVTLYDLEAEFVDPEENEVWYEFARAQSTADVCVAWQDQFSIAVTEAAELVLRTVAKTNRSVHELCQRFGLTECSHAG